MSGNRAPSGEQGRPAGSRKRYSLDPQSWLLEVPESGKAGNDPSGCRRIEDIYEYQGKLGSGTYGDVYRAADRGSGDRVALKRIKMENEKEGFPITALREIKILSHLATAEDVDDDSYYLRNNIIGLREIVRSDNHKSNNNKGSIYMVFDFMDHDMAGLLARTSYSDFDKFSIPQIKRYMLQLFSGLALLQKNNVLHRDLKNANLLVSNRGELKIADFGLARQILSSKDADAQNQGTSAGGGGGGEDGIKSGPTQNVAMTNRVITLWYRPPELCLGTERYGLEVDIWSAGCIMVEMLMGKAFFPGKDEINQLELICKTLGKPTEENMPGCTRLSRYAEYVTDNPEFQKIPSMNRMRNVLTGRVPDSLAIDLIEKLLTLDPEARITAEKACQDPWFRSHPLPARWEDMPRHEESHELGMKKQRQDMKAGIYVPPPRPPPAQKQPLPQQQQQQQHQQQQEQRRSPEANKSRPMRNAAALQPPLPVSQGPPGGGRPTAPAPAAHAAPMGAHQHYQHLFSAGTIPGAQMMPPTVGRAPPFHPGGGMPPHGPPPPPHPQGYLPPDQYHPQYHQQQHPQYALGSGMMQGSGPMYHHEQHPQHQNQQGYGHQHYGYGYPPGGPHGGGGRGRGGGGYYNDTHHNRGHPRSNRGGRSHQRY